MLSPESLLAEARAQAGLDDFGDGAFREGLRVLCETYDGEAQLSPAGRKRTRRRLVQLLATRLRVEAAWKRHPEARAVPGFAGSSVTKTSTVSGKSATRPA